MRPVLFSLFMVIAVSSQQEETSSLCSRLGVVHYKIFPLSSEIKKSLCQADKPTCSAFEMFASNDFAREVVHLKRKIGCYPNKETDGIEQSEMCNRLRALPEASSASLEELFANDHRRLAIFKPMLSMMQSATEEWLLPLLEEFC